MSRYKAYPAYQDSEVEWLGDMPSHWACISVGRLYRRTKRTNFPEKELLSVYRDHGVVPTSSRDDNNNKPSEDMAAYQLVEPDNLVMNKMKAWQGSIAISEYEGIVSPAYFVYEPNAKMFDLAIPKYIHYLLRHPIYVAQYLRQSKGIRVNQWDLDPDEFKKIELLLPAKEEQKKIINFLDHETAKIDTLIEKQQRLIELLKEKRQAVISHAVTKGLNPDAPMKESGVEWLGEVPAHWGTTYLKYATSMIVDCPHETPVYSEDGQYLVIRTADLNEGHLDSSKMYRVQDDEYIRRVRRADLKRGDIVYGREGERWGHAGLVPESARYCLGQRIMQFRVGLDFSPDFLMWLLNSDNVYKQGQLDTVGATSPHVNVSTIRNFSLTQPPLLEQKEIGRFLNEKSRRIDELIDMAVKTISLLQERRTALISAAVTGKIDVRDWQAAA